MAIAASRTPWTITCLPRALTLLWSLDREAIPGAMRIGTRRIGGVLEAHAWIESGDLVLDDRPDVYRHYHPFESRLVRVGGETR